MKFIYREIKENDKNIVNDLYEKLLEDNGGSVGMGYGYPNYIYKELFAEKKQWNSFVSVLIDDNCNEIKIIGYIMLQYGKEYLYIQGLYVEKEFRGLGIGKELISVAENYAKNMNCFDISAEMNYLLFNFYEKLGFHIDKQKNHNTYLITKKLKKTPNLC